MLTSTVRQGESKTPLKEILTTEVVESVFYARKALVNFRF